ncbi:MAG: PilT/PilU family type 4a pilus ATPase [Paludisphaera borealis]|uniref:type IV pilus twitching motility protein PilT n=1 Tax=Paludisphaera borealis TaxID=1387353 RepID=UPI002852359C|nr:PilT/PilU family type 4a pilus ATPase [Paludisphaera borealis]MDR3621672.1 PilT/PilU family type 4a pilus ATPase [Paludisphaera borealis]
MSTATDSSAIEPNVEVASTEPEANKLFRMCIKYKGSDLHLKVGMPPSMRLAGVLRQMQLPPLTASDMERLMYPLLTPRQRGILDEEGGADFAHIIYDGDVETRFRVNLFKQRGRLSLVARRVNNKIPTFEDLHLPAVLAEITQYDQGIIILAGVTGSGKSTTIASMLQYVNQRERMHIVTIEDPIEYTFKDDKSIINQREIGIDVLNWDIALKHAVRQDPDIILVGEMRDRETFSAAMHAAETGHLVFGTIHAGTAPSTISRLLDLFPREMHAPLRQSLAFNLKAVVAQKLLPTTKEWADKGVGRVPTNEIMRINPTVKKLILSEEDTKLGDAIRIGKDEGMLDFTESLRLLVVAEKIERATAFEVAPSPEALKMALKGITINQPGIL